MNKRIKSTLIKIEKKPILAVKYLLSTVLIPAVIVMRIIKPIYKIRLGFFSVDSVGHFALDLGIALSRKELLDEDTLDLYFFQEKACNSQLSIMAKRYFHIYTWVEYLYYANEFIGGIDKLIPQRNISNSSDIDGVLFSSKSTLDFLPREIESGKNYMKGKGWFEGEKFVCLQVRDSAYFAKNDRNTSKHSYRNSDINSFSKAIYELIERGYWIVRVGRKANDRLTIKHDRVIDYAFDNKSSDFLDIWLMANCNFCISTGSGTDAVAIIHRKPILFVNYNPISHSVTHTNSISIPKHLIWKKNKKELTLIEHIYHAYAHSNNYNEMGIDLISLSPEEILDATIEICDRLNGEWKDTKDDMERQENFWKIFNNGGKYENSTLNKFSNLQGFVHPNAKIGASFLRSVPNFLKTSDLSKINRETYN